MIDASSAFLLVFLVSMGLTIVTFLLGVGSFPALGGMHLHGGVGHHGVHMGHHAAPLRLAPARAGSGAAPGGHSLAQVPGSGQPRGPIDESASPLNMSTMLAFVTWFSGAGYVLTGWEGVSTLVASAIATLVGFVGAGIVFLVLVRILLPGQTDYLHPEDYELEGTIGRLITSVRPGGTGEFVFSKAGSRHVASARSSSGAAIERDTEAVVVRQERGIVYVEPFTELLAESSRAARG